MGKVSLERRIRFLPAFDRRMATGGVQGVEMHWYAIGAKGAVHWTVYTNWHLPAVERDLDRDSTATMHHVLCHPIPVTVGYHSAEPRTGVRAHRCDVCAGGKCFYTDSPLAAVPLYELLLTQGDEAVWIELERSYKEEYGNPDQPADTEEAVGEAHHNQDRVE